MEEEIERIATRIRNWRGELGLTLQQLADRSRVSVSTIHKIENNQRAPTIGVLIKIAEGLNRRPSQLLEEVSPQDHIRVMRKDEGQVVPMNERGSLEQLAGEISGGRLEAWSAWIDPLSDTGKEAESTEDFTAVSDWKFNGEMVILVKEGCVVVDIGGELFSLSVGDSIHFDTSLRHSWFAGGGKPAQAMLLGHLPERFDGFVQVNDVRNRARAFRLGALIPGA